VQLQRLPQSSGAPQHFTQSVHWLQWDRQNTEDYTWKRWQRDRLFLARRVPKIVFGRTIAGLWLPEEERDLRACVARSLPPVYAVRFA